MIEKKAAVENLEAMLAVKGSSFLVFVTGEGEATMVNRRTGTLI